MPEMYYRLHLFLFYLGLLLVFGSIFFESHWFTVFIIGIALSIAGLAYYWYRIWQKAPALLTILTATAPSLTLRGPLLDTEAGTRIHFLDNFL